jgi:sugar/nucleoside kinase (ribokinase family)
VAEFLALTPQGLARDWSASDDRMRSIVPVAGEDLAARCQALVLSAHERPSCEGLIRAAVRAGALVAVTDGPSSTAVLGPHRDELHVPVPSLAHVVDHLGAGDVFAAAFFIALAEGRDAVTAASFATAAAAVRTQGAGPGAIGRREAIEQRWSATAAAGSGEP